MNFTICAHTHAQKKSGKIAQANTFMTYLNFGQCQGEKKNHKKNCNKAKKWEK